MAATYLGAVSLGDFVVGIKAAVDPLGAALAAAKVAANAVLTAVATAELAVKAAVDAALASTLTAHAAIRLAALADLQAQLSAAVAITAQLSVAVTDPSLYISGLLAGTVAVNANLSALVPSVAVGAQLSAAVALTASLTAKIAAFDLVLDAILGVPKKLKIAIDAAFAVLIQATVDLQATINAIDAALAVYVDLTAKFSLSAAPAYRFDGQLQDLAADIDARITGGDTGGLLLTDNVRAWVLAVPTSAVPMLNAATELLKSYV